MNMLTKPIAAHLLDEKGRCCGRKPMIYKSRTYTGMAPHRYCPRCDRAYDLEENEQIPNWAWMHLPDGTFVSNTNRGPGARSAAEVGHND